jgi:hypothetical protein
MVVKKADSGNEWPPELWYRARFDGTYEEWISAAIDWGKAHHHNVLPIVQMLNQRIGAPRGGPRQPGCLPDRCRQKVRPRRINGHNGATW